MSKADEFAELLDTGSTAFADDTVVDVDVHMSYSADLRRKVARYMDKPYRGYTDPDTASDGYPDHGWPKSLGGARKFHLMDVTSPEDVVEPLCEGFGVDHPIVNVSSPVDDFLKHDRALAEARAINDFLLDDFLDEDDRLRGLATIPARDPDFAVEEVERIADEDGIVGVYFSVCQEFSEPMGDPKFDELYRTLEDNDLTPVYHITGIHRNAQVLRRLQKVASWHATGPAWAAQLTLTSLVMQGTAEKFPDLDFLLLEGGLGWVPGMMARLNREYGQWRNELPLLERSPEQAIRDQFYFGTQPLPEFEDPQHMRWLLEMIGSDSLMFSTDHPHYDFDHPSQIDKFLRNFDDDERAAVLADNARGVFDL